jgi:hypothetical protein
VPCEHGVVEDRTHPLRQCSSIFWITQDQGMATIDQVIGHPGPRAHDHRHAGSHGLQGSQTEGILA